MLADDFSAQLLAETLNALWQILKMTWPLWLMLVGVAVLRVVVEDVITRRRLRREERLRQAAAVDTLRRQGPSSVLQALAALHGTGALSDDEWARAKEIALSIGDARVDAVASQIQRLYSLHKEGALSQSEFNSKKWELLSRGH